MHHLEASEANLSHHDEVGTAIEGVMEVDEHV